MLQPVFHNFEAQRDSLRRLAKEKSMSILWDSEHLMIIEKRDKCLYVTERFAYWLP